MLKRMGICICLAVFSFLCVDTILHRQDDDQIKKDYLQRLERSFLDIKMKMTTPVPRPISRSPKLSAEFLSKFYSQQMKKRIENMKGIRANSSFATLYNVLVPEVYCPDLVRVGNVNDGGKWICNPKEMPQSNCSIYSLGLRDDISFDQDIQAFNNNSCSIYGYDKKEQAVNTIKAYEEINGKIQKKAIAAMTNIGATETSIEDLLRSNGDNYTEFLKIDIEGAEYKALPPFLKSNKPCQIFIEIHGKAVEMRDLLFKIAENGYYLFFYEVNGDSLAACEYSFIHENCHDRYGTFLLAPYLRNSLI